jgi:hypothetical protein
MAKLQVKTIPRIRELFTLALIGCANKHMGTTNKAPICAVAKFIIDMRQSPIKTEAIMTAFRSLHSTILEYGDPKTIYKITRVSREPPAQISMHWVEGKSLVSDI